ncbi:MAG TPA: bifunctional diaminohydroxyphosphoribosylaminopyrimidine deaminase/5-amino-6-(5-phosphoribosylamino)uracil reductase RibD [Bacteroidia bacterium]|nr:bifunctional diaminohydroxyphosphoribosylaminopyrimidine deaminase/5-amino-6-(5-phosphoribosylamino)uracil reductase RibD [Bacteroidia bacterium]
MADKPMTDLDETFMREALLEGAKGLGTTSPNPAVGAVVVRDGEVIGRGWHEHAGEPHAERRALADAVARHGQGAVRDSTLYVTLEPCSTHGRTPPCTDAIVEAGIRRVVVAATDPNPLHSGAAFGLLRSHGIEVAAPVLEAEGKELIRFFAKRTLTGLPWVIAKTASTLDGCTTLPEEMGPWISNEAAREDVQRWRRQCDAILVGGATFRRDNPSLTLRGKWAEDRPQPWRVVLTSRDDLPADHRLFTDGHSDRTLVHRGLALRESLAKLGEIGVQSVMLESGGRLLASALGDGLVDEMILYLAPMLGGGEQRIVPPEIDGIVARLEAPEVATFGDNLRIRARVAGRSSEI